MNELGSVIQAWQKSSGAGKRTALATVIDVNGSAYRRPGARMLLAETGPIAGSISAGCLERDVVERSRRVIDTGRPQLIKYDTRGDADAIWGHGLGCNGVVRVLLESLGGSDQVLNSLALAEEWLSVRNRGVIATLFDDDPDQANCQEFQSPAILQRWAVSEDQFCALAVGEGGNLVNRVWTHMRHAFQLGRSGTVRDVQSGASVFLDVIKPPSSLLIFGAEADALPLVRLAKFMGWHVTVIDVKARQMSFERFPEADDILLLRSENFDEGLRLNPDDSVVVMTHSYLDDVQLLSKLAQTSIKYLGVLGPRDRTNRIMSDAFQNSEQYVGPAANLHSPIGVDLGGETPEEVALAIVAEITAVSAGGSAGFLRDRIGSIHGETTSTASIDPAYFPSSAEQMAEFTCGVA